MQPDIIRPQMAQTDKQREVYVCQLVADEINTSDGTDYRAVSCNPDPPDVQLLSHSGRYPTRNAEVVSTPQDFTIRYDNKNILKFERKLRAALVDMGFSGYYLSVHWSKSAIRFGIKDDLILALAGIVKANAPSSGALTLRGVEVYKYSPAVSRIVGYMSIFRLPYSGLDVHSASSWWAPRDGRWIEEAVTRKTNQYRSGSVAASLMLVVDGLSFVELEQLEAFRANNPPERIPFAELWVVTMGRAYRLKRHGPARVPGDV